MALGVLEGEDCAVALPGEGVAEREEQGEKEGGLVKVGRGGVREVEEEMEGEREAPLETVSVKLERGERDMGGEGL